VRFRVFDVVENASIAPAANSGEIHLRLVVDFSLKFADQEGAEELLLDDVIIIERGWTLLDNRRHLVRLALVHVLIFLSHAPGNNTLGGALLHGRPHVARVAHNR